MQPTFPSSLRRPTLMTVLAVLLLFIVAGLLLSVEEKKLTIFASGKTYSVAVIDSDSSEYVALSEVLQPLGKLKLHAEGRTLQVQLDDVSGEFSEGKKLARVGRAQLLLPAKAIVDQGRMLVPLRSISRIVKQYTQLDADLHEQGRRLFIGPVSESFTIEIKRPENNLMLSFPNLVTPVISTEGNKVRLTFAKDPVTFGADSMIYNDKVITAVSLSEHNGSAQILVSGTSALAANLQEGGKTISIGAIPVAAAAPPPSSPPQPTPSTPATTQAQATVAVPTAQPQLQAPALPSSTVPFFVMIDPSHGGGETGARFSDKLLEKDITLSFARRLRTELHNKGITAVLLRDSDATIPYEQRALTTNAQRAAIYVSVHAGMPGSGVRVYTSLPGSHPAQKTGGPFIPWELAQESHLERSRLLANTLVTELASAKITSGSASAPLLPLGQIAAPAVAIEISPSTVDGKPDSITSSKYQQTIAVAMAAAIVNARPMLEARP